MATFDWPPEIERKIHYMKMQGEAAEVIQRCWRSFTTRMHFLVDSLFGQCIRLCKSWYYDSIHAIIRIPRFSPRMRQQSIFVDLADPDSVAFEGVMMDLVDPDPYTVFLPAQFLMEREHVLMHARVHADDDEAYVQIVKHYGDQSERVVRKRSYLRRIKNQRVKLRRRKNRLVSLYSDAASPLSDD